MIRAGIISNTGGGYVAVVVAERIGATWRVISAKSFEVGQLVNRIEPTRDARGRELDMERVITVADIAGITSIIVSMVSRCDNVRIASISNQVTEALQLALPDAELMAEAQRRATIDVSAAFPSWVPPEQGANLLVRAAELASRLTGTEILDAPETEAHSAAQPTAESKSRRGSPIDFEAIRERARKLSAGALEKLVPESRKPPHPLQGTGVASLSSLKAIGEEFGYPDSTAELPAMTIGGVPFPGICVVPIPSRLAGIDPGSRHLGLVITDGTTLPLRIHLAKTVPIGGKEILKKPIVRKRKDGSEFVIESKNTFDDATIDEQADAIVAELVSNQVARLIMERVFSAFAHEGQSASLAASQTTELLKTMWLCALIRERAQKAGIKVATVSRTSWLAKVAGRPRGKSKGGEQVARLLPALREYIVDWPTQTDNHQRDAGGLPIWFRLVEAEQTEKMERAALKLENKKSPRVKKPRPPRIGPTKEALIEQRKRVGCTCLDKKKHRGKCPLAKNPQWFIELEARNAQL